MPKENNIQPPVENSERCFSTEYQHELNALVESFNEGFITDHSLKKELEGLRKRHLQSRENSFQRGNLD